MNTRTAVLIIDAFQSVRDVLRRALERHGYEVFASTSCEGGLQILDSQEIDAVIVDSRAPGISARTFFHVLASKWPHLIPRTIVTVADPMANDHQRWLKGAELPVVFKPFLPSEVCALLDQVMAARPENSSSAD